MDQQHRQQRLQRHRKLMFMIENYTPAKEDIERLQNIKRDTEFQIAVRFMKSLENRDYVFPLRELEDDEDEVEQFPGRVSFQETFYDLCKQNWVAGKQKVEKSTTGRRVKSLGPEKIHEIHTVRMAQRSQGQKQERINLPKIMSSKIVLKSLQKQRNFEKSQSNQKSQKRTIKLKANRPKHSIQVDDKNHLRLKNLLARKMMTQQQQILHIGAVTMLLDLKRIHSPVKPSHNNRKLMTEL